VQKSLTEVFQTPTSLFMLLNENVFLETDDTVEIKWRNISNTTNITATDAKLIIGVT